MPAINWQDKTKKARQRQIENRKPNREEREGRKVFLFAYRTK